MVRLLEGETERLLCLDIIRKLGIAIEFGRNEFRVRMGELEMVTYNGEHRRVCPLVPTACSYNKLDKYFGKLQKSQISALHVQGEFGRAIWKFGK